MTTLIPRLYAVDKTTGALTPLDYWRKIELSPVRNEAGAVTVDYPADTPGFSTLFDGVDAAGNRDVEAEVHISGSATGRFRCLLQEKAGDELGSGKMWTFSGGFLEQLLAEVLVYPGSGPGYTSKREMLFSAVSPGAVLIAVVQQVQARGGLAGVTWDFSASVDSAGVSWATSLTNLTLSPQTSVMAVASKLVDLQVMEFEVTAGRVLRAWNAGGRGVDRTTGSTPLRFVEAVNLGKAGRRESSRTPNSGTAVLVKGADGFYGQASDSSAQSARGRRVEVGADAGNIASQAGVDAAAATQMQIKKIGVATYEYAVALGAGNPAPRLDFEVGDWGYCAVGQQWVRRRISQYVLTFEHGKPPSAVAALNDLVLDPLVALYRKLAALTDGGAVVGTSTSPDGADTVGPNAPTGLVASSDAYLDGPYALAAVTVGWTPPSTNTDGSSFTDVGGYRVQVKYATDPTASWQSVAELTGAASSASFEATPGAVISIRVAAYDTSGNFSSWATLASHTVATYTATVPVPSTPVAADYLGTVLGTWDGKTSTGAAMPLNVQVNGYVEVHMSTSSSFTPVAPTPTAPGATFQSRLYGPGKFAISDLTYGQGYYFKLVAVDSAGNRSSPSASSAVATPAQAGNLDIGSVNVGKLTAGNLSVAVTLTGSVLAGTPGAGRIEEDSGGIRIYNPANVQIGLLGTAGYNWLTGEMRTAISGQRIVMNPGGSNADRIDFYPGSGTTFGSIESSLVAGEAAISVFGNRDQASTAYGGMMLIRRSWAALYYGRRDYADITSEIYTDGITARINSPIVDLAVDTRTTAAGGNRVSFTMFDSSRNKIAGTQLNYWATGASEPWLAAVNRDCGLVFASSPQSGLNARIYVVGNDSTLRRDLYVYSLLYEGDIVKVSTRRVKEQIRPADRIDLRAAVRDVGPVRYRLRAQPEQEHIGLIAEDMPAAVQQPIPQENGDTLLGINESAFRALVVWDGFRQVLGELDQLRAELVELRGEAA